MLRFRSDHAFMSATEMEARQKASKKLQDDLREQMEEKKRRQVSKLPCFKKELNGSGKRETKGT